MPITRSPVFLQKVSSRRTSPTDTAWGPGRGPNRPMGDPDPRPRAPGAGRSAGWGGTWKWEDALPYLRRGDHDGPQGAVGPEGFHGRHVLVGGSRRRVHNQEVQLSPGHVSHKLLYQSCEGPGGSGGRSQKGAPTPAASTLLLRTWGGSTMQQGPCPHKHHLRPSCWATYSASLLLRPQRRPVEW